MRDAFEGMGCASRWVETQISPFSSRERKRATQIFPSPASPLSLSTARPWSSSSPACLPASPPPRPVPSGTCRPWPRPLAPTRAAAQAGLVPRLPCHRRPCGSRAPYLRVLWPALRRVCAAIRVDAGWQHRCCCVAECPSGQAGELGGHGPASRGRRGPANRGNLHRVRTPRPISELRLLQAPAMEELIPAPVAPCRRPRPHERVRAGELPPAARSSSMPVAAPATRRPRRRPPEQLRADARPSTS